MTERTFVNEPNNWSISGHELHGQMPNSVSKVRMALVESTVAGRQVNVRKNCSSGTNSTEGSSENELKA